MFRNVGSFTRLSAVQWNTEQRQNRRKGKQNTEVRTDDIAVVLTCRNSGRIWVTNKLTHLLIIGKKQSGRTKYIPNESKSMSTRL
jgi:hypothetical protein